MNAKAANETKAGSSVTTQLNKPSPATQITEAGALAVNPALPPTTLKACYREGARTTLYMHIYDESSRISLSLAFVQNNSGSYRLFSKTDIPLLIRSASGSSRMNAAAGVILEDLAIKNQFWKSTIVEGIIFAAEMAETPQE